MLAMILSEFGGYLAVGLAALATIFTVYFRGRSAGIDEERVEHQVVVQKQAEQAKQEVRDVEAKIEAEPDNAVRERARSKWVRR